MSKNDFHELTDRLGRVHDAASGDRIGMGRLTASPEQIVLEYLPDNESAQAMLLSVPTRKVPERLVFVDSTLVKAPREGLDFICIADLGTWVRKTTVLPQRFLDRGLRTNSIGRQFAGEVGEDSRVLTGLGRDYEQQNLSPLTNFIGALWDKLAINDPTLKPLADGLRFTKTMDTSHTMSTGQKVYSLSEVTTPDIAKRHRNSEPWMY